VIATASYCTFMLGPHRCGVEVDAVREVVRDQPITPVPLAPAAVRGLVNLRGRIVTAVDLRRCLGLEPAAPGPARTLVVLRASVGDMSFIVDGIHDVCDLDPEAFEPTPPTVQGTGRELIRGAYKLNDQLLVVLDLARTMEAAAA
jgi:purine-binding chemotaxis protein CheW